LVGVNAAPGFDADQFQQAIGLKGTVSNGVHGTPELYFMHFWAQGAPDKVAAGLKAAIGELKK
jgi:hypothetical protein